jgi:septum site-determining protein MinC
VNNPVPRASAFSFKGKSFVAYVLTPEPPMPDWLGALDGWLARSPAFFVRRPVLLDGSKMNPTLAELEELLAELSKRDIRILGIDGVDEAVVAASMPPLVTGGRDRQEVGYSERSAAKPQKSSSLVIEKSVRSGQSIAHLEGDVTVLGPVASGAEIMAGGSIHIYGALRGRVIAGSTGDTRARIFCQKLDAELVAISGFYRSADAIDEGLRGRPVQAWLEGDAIKIAALN